MAPKPSRKQAQADQARPAEDREAVRRWFQFLASVRMEDISLRRLEASRPDKPDLGDTPVSLTPEVDFNTEELFSEPETREFGARFTLIFRAFVRDLNNLELAHIEVEFLALYDVGAEAPWSEDHVSRFIAQNAPFHCWPFARSHLFSLSREMGLPSYLLEPLLVGPGSGKRSTDKPSV